MTRTSNNTCAKVSRDITPVTDVLTMCACAFHFIVIGANAPFIKASCSRWRFRMNCLCYEDNGSTNYWALHNVVAAPFCATTYTCFIIWRALFQTCKMIHYHLMVCLHQLLLLVLKAWPFVNVRHVARLIMLLLSKSCKRCYQCRKSIDATKQMNCSKCDVVRCSSQ